MDPDESARSRSRCRDEGCAYGRPSPSTAAANLPLCAKPFRRGGEFSRAARGANYFGLSVGPFPARQCHHYGTDARHVSGGCHAPHFFRALVRNCSDLDFGLLRDAAGRRRPLAREPDRFMRLARGLARLSSSRGRHARERHRHCSGARSVVSAAAVLADRRSGDAIDASCPRNRRISIMRAHPSRSRGSEARVGTKRIPQLKRGHARPRRQSAAAAWDLPRYDGANHPAEHRRGRELV